MYCRGSQWSKSSWEHQHRSFIVCLLVSVNPSFYYLCFHHANQKLDCPRNKLPHKSLFGNIALSLTMPYFCDTGCIFHSSILKDIAQIVWMMSQQGKRITVPLGRSTQQCDMQVDRKLYLQKGELITVGAKREKGEDSLPHNAVWYDEKTLIWKLWLQMSKSNSKHSFKKKNKKWSKKLQELQNLLIPSGVTNFICCIKDVSNSS